MARTAIVAGATGLVGGEVLTALLADDSWSSVVTVGRRATDVSHPKLVEHVVDLLDPGELPPATHIFSALGTTRRQAGSKEAFARVDHDAVVAVAQAGARVGVSWFGHITAVGSDPRSPFFYNRVKGRAEADVAASGIPTTVAFRPSFLDGHRIEPRPMEHAGLVLARLATPLLRAYRPIPATVVARAMLAAATDLTAGHRTVGSRELWHLGR